MTALRAGSLILAGLVGIQVYLAGLAVFGAATFRSHALLGWSGIFFAWGLVVVAAVTARGHWRVSLALIAAFLTMAQPILAFAPRARFPWVSAFHAPNALAIIAVSLLLALRARSTPRQASQ